MVFISIWSGQRWTEAIPKDFSFGDIASLLRRLAGHRPKYGADGHDKSGLTTALIRNEWGSTAYLIPKFRHWWVLQAHSLRARSLI